MSGTRSIRPPLAIDNDSAAKSSGQEDSAAFDRRQKNSLHYLSPRWRGWTMGSRKNVLRASRLALIAETLGYTKARLRCSAGRRHFVGAGVRDAASTLTGEPTGLCPGSRWHNHAARMRAWGSGGSKARQVACTTCSGPSRGLCDKIDALFRSKYGSPRWQDAPSLVG